MKRLAISERLIPEESRRPAAISIAIVLAAASALALAGCGRGARPAPPADPVDALSWLNGKSEFGCSSVLMEREGLVIYVDPASLPDTSGLPKADYILITHGHRDHLDISAVKGLSKKGTRIIGSYDAIFRFSQAKVAMTKALKPGDKLKNRDFSLEAVPMFTRGETSDHPRAMDWIGFVLTIGKEKYYFAGSSGLTEEMDSLAGIDVAVVCTHLDGDIARSGDIIRWAGVAKPGAVVPIHWSETSYAGLQDIEALKSGMPGGTALRLLEKRK